MLFLKLRVVLLHVFLLCHVLLNFFCCSLSVDDRIFNYRPDAFFLNFCLFLLWITFGIDCLYDFIQVIVLHVSVFEECLHQMCESLLLLHEFRSEAGRMEGVPWLLINNVDFCTHLIKLVSSLFVLVDKIWSYWLETSWIR